MRDVVVPKMGMSTVEVEILQWQVEVGDAVEVGNELVEVETEKLTTLIESEVAGVVTEILVAAGDIVPVGAVICRVRPAEPATS